MPCLWALKGTEKLLSEVNVALSVQQTIEACCVLGGVTRTLNIFLSSVLSENKLLSCSQSEVSSCFLHHKRDNSRRGLSFFLVWLQMNSITFLGLCFPMNNNIPCRHLQDDKLKGLFRVGSFLSTSHVAVQLNYKHVVLERTVTDLMLKPGRIGSCLIPNAI